MSAPAVAVSSDGKELLAAWMDHRVRRGDANVYWATSTGSAFAQDALLSGETRGEQNHPAVTVDSAGKAWAAWEDGREGKERQRIWVRSSGPEDMSRAVSSEAEGVASFPAITSSAGLVALVYEAAKDGEQTVVFRLLEPGAK